MRRILDYWAVILLSALAFLFTALICEASWPIAYVYVVSTPTGASVFDGEGYYWTTPAHIPVSQKGLSITVSHPGRVTVDTLITPRMSSAPVLVNLPYMFPVTVTSYPPGADVFLDGSRAGSTPLLLQLDEPGLHRLRLTLEGLAVLHDSFSLADNFPDTLHYLLPRPADNRMIFVPAGEGSPSGLDHSFMISRYEVTNGEFCEYLRWMEPAPVRDTTNRWGRTDLLESVFPSDYPLPFHIGPDGRWTVREGFEEHPVTGLRFRSAMDYCDWLTMRDGSGPVYRLPVEDEWRTAYLAGGAGPWPWGEGRPGGRLLNLSDSNEGMLRRHPSIDDGFSHTAPAGSFPCNGWGLYDMAGNVWEYCLPADSGGAPVALGGGWLSSAEDCGADAVMVPDTGLGYPFVGFRLAAIPRP